MTEHHENSKKTPNRLIQEKSPYLLQHAYNPVDWYAWGDEPFARAKAENKKMLATHLPFYEDINKVEGKATAYPCKNYSCQLPPHEADELD